MPTAARSLLGVVFKNTWKKQLKEVTLRGPLTKQHAHLTKEARSGITICHGIGDIVLKQIKEQG